MYVVGQIIFCFFLVLFLRTAKMSLAIPPHPLQSQKRENTLSRFWQMPPSRKGGRGNGGVDYFFTISHFFSRFVTSFSLKREEEETKEHLVRKSGKASVVEEEKKEKCAYG